jgi:hypothetical protein
MSHFTVLVIGDDIERQLAPFQENNMEDCPKEFLKFSAYPKIGDQQFFDSEEEAKTALGENFDPEDSFWENPNAKWDWFQVGGRWTGIFKLKPDTVGTLGKPGLMTPVVPNGFADSALKKDIDFEGMRTAAGDAAAKLWDKVNALVGDLLPTFISWHKMRNEIHVGNIDEARKAYHAQETVIKFNTDEDLFWKEPSDFNCTREVYVQRAKDSAICTFAVLKDGKWYERGEMGWWGCVSDEKKEDEWSQEFSKLLDSLSDDTLLTVVDCHI